MTMLNFSHLLIMALAANTVSAFTFDRLNKSDAMLLVVDHQMGLFQLVRDYSPDEYKNNILAHAAIGKVFDLPTILTSSAEHGKS
jgi:hypothetical protein